MDNQTAFILRTCLQFAAGFMIKKGIGDSETWEMVIGGVLSAVGIFLSWRSAKQKTQLAQDKATLKAAVTGQIDSDHPAVVEILAEPVKKNDPDPPPAIMPK